MTVRIALRVLRSTAAEQICVQGYEGAKPVIEQLRLVSKELVDFWGLDEEQLELFDGMVKCFSEPK